MFQLETELISGPENVNKSLWAVIFVMFLQSWQLKFCSEKSNLDFEM